jgi:hypothetical protein
MSSDWDPLTAVVVWRPQQPNPLGEINGEVEAPHDGSSPTAVSGRSDSHTIEGRGRLLLSRTTRSHRVTLTVTLPGDSGHHSH